MVARFRAIGVIFPLLLVSCSMTRPVELWTDEALAVQQLEDHGNLEEADDQYQRLLQSPPDGANQRWLKFRRAEILRKTGKIDDALSAYKVLWQDEQRDEWGSRAMYQTATLYAQLGQHDDAFAFLLQTVFRYPNEVSAENALHDIAKRLEDTPNTLVALLADMTPYLDHSLLAGNIRFLHAQILDQRLGRIDDAAMLYREIYVDFKDDGMADDALWEMTQIYRRVQAWKPAVQNLEVLANSMESSWFVGSYNSPWVSSAIFDLGLIHLLHLGDYPAAIDWFETFVQEFDDSLRAPEALFYIAEARRLDGDDQAYRKQLRHLVATYPDSKWARKANARLDQGTP